LPKVKKIAVKIQTEYQLGLLKVKEGEDPNELIFKYAFAFLLLEGQKPSIILE
jgi:hypothetical protein